MQVGTELPGPPSTRTPQSGPTQNNNTGRMNGDPSRDEPLMMQYSTTQPIKIDVVKKN